MGRFVAIVLLILVPGVSQAGVERFNGKWQTTVSCEPSRGALGFSYRFISEVKDGKLKGLHGTEDRPGYLYVEGVIEDDGAAKLYAKGQTNGKEFVPGRDTPPGTEFGYHVNAHFDEHKGTGSRVEGRACSYEFERKEVNSSGN
ncbi:MAG: hypothetical protein ACLPY1_17870 [Terracidiphilus sp.]